MAGFGFAQPLQRHLSFTSAAGGQPQAQRAENPAPEVKQGTGDIRANLQKLGLLRPTEPGSSLPSVTVAAPPMPTGSSLDDPSQAIAQGASRLAANAGYGADQPGSQNGGSGIDDFLSALFGG